MSTTLRQVAYIQQAVPQIHNKSTTNRVSEFELKPHRQRSDAVHRAPFRTSKHYPLRPLHRVAGNDIILHVEWDVKLDFPNDADVISLAVAERPRDASCH